MLLFPVEELSSTLPVGKLVKNEGWLQLDEVHDKEKSFSGFCRTMGISVPPPFPSFTGRTTASACISCLGGEDSFMSTIASEFWETVGVFVGSLARNKKECVLSTEHYHQPSLGCS